MKYTLKGLTIVLAMIVGICQVQAQTPLSKKERTQVAKTISSNYSNWGKVAISGKLKLDILPVNPTVKIYMEKKKLFMMSLSVPFMGEVGRMEVTPDTLLVVNKMKKVYTKASFADSDLFSNRETTESFLEQLQSLILGRVVIPGRGELSTKNCKALDFYNNTDGGWMLVPSEKKSMVDYGYVVDANGLISALLVNIADGEFGVMATYTYVKNNTNIAISIKKGEKEFGATLILEAPRFGDKGFNRFNGKGYQSVTLESFIKSFSL